MISESGVSSDLRPGKVSAQVGGHLGEFVCHILGGQALGNGGISQIPQSLRHFK